VKLNEMYSHEKKAGGVAIKVEEDDEAKNTLTK